MPATSSQHPNKFWQTTCEAPPSTQQSKIVNTTEDLSSSTSQKHLLAPSPHLKNRDSGREGERSGREEGEERGRQRRGKRERGGWRERRTLFWPNCLSAFSAAAVNCIQGLDAVLFQIHHRQELPRYPQCWFLPAMFCVCKHRTPSTSLPSTSPQKKKNRRGDAFRNWKKKEQKCRRKLWDTVCTLLLQLSDGTAGAAGGERGREDWNSVSTETEVRHLTECSLQPSLVRRRNLSLPAVVFEQAVFDWGECLCMSFFLLL